MGCDGGTIPKRHELVRTKQKSETTEKQVELDMKWKYCVLTNQLLTEPIVACELGRLYNKDAVIEYLLDKDKDKPKMDHIKGLKDLHTLVLTKNPSWDNKAEKGDSYIDTNAAKYICPVAGIEMNGRYSFSYIGSCNCVLSDRALKQVRDNVCPVCCKQYTVDDVIVINGNEEQVSKLEEKLLKRKEMKSKNGKTKKKKDKVVVVEVSGPSTSGVTSDTVRNLSSATTVLGAKHKLQEEKIFQTKTFKSLFTSHPSAKRGKDKNGHWVTYNPYHYAG
uniref:protein RTF2 homolog n=1 Tax=Ciona intestinalis TaxID=7719 RepID=UPI00006A3D7E|nr:protein RTF2 homolog [Ciona intestinalis]|eukprot:XP_002125002.1 protein RTF2 homolog [Ciona intestinalis]